MSNLKAHTILQFRIYLQKMELVKNMEDQEDQHNRD